MAKCAIPHPSRYPALFRTWSLHLLTTTCRKMKSLWGHDGLFMPFTFFSALDEFHTLPFVHFEAVWEWCFFTLKFTFNDCAKGKLHSCVCHCIDTFWMYCQDSFFHVNVMTGLHIDAMRCWFCSIFLESVNKLNNSWLHWSVSCVCPFLCVACGLFLLHVGGHVAVNDYILCMLCTGKCTKKGRTQLFKHAVE